MKKIMIVALALGLLAPAAVFAADLNGTAGIVLSNNVTGTYFNNGVTPATAYQLSAGHAQGNRVFASGSADSQIYYKAIAGTVFNTSDLISAYGTPTTFSSSTAWTAL